MQNDPRISDIAGSLSVIDTWPGPHAVVFSGCLGWAEKRGDVAVALHGSAMKGKVDVYSDIDLTVAAEGIDPSVAAQDFVQLLGELGAPLAIFGADHLGASNVVIGYVEVDGWVVKVDARFVKVGNSFSLPKEARAIHGPSAAFAQAVREEQIPPQIGILARKLCGWLWFTHGRAARGELFAAARSIDFSREYALLPIVLARLSLPQDGHRRIEERLPAEVLQPLRSTYPTILSRSEIHRALKALYELMISELGKVEFTEREAVLCELARMWDLVTASQRRLEEAESGGSV